MQIAVLYVQSHIAETVYDHLNAFGQYSRHNMTYFNVLTDSISLDKLNDFDVIVLHYTVRLFSDACCPPLLRFALSKTRAKKVAFIQDEYTRVNDIIENLKLLQIDCLYSCIPKSELDKVYAKSILPDLMIRTTLTGYINDRMLSQSPLPTYNQRRLDVVYRARKLSAWYGKLCYDKWRIAERFEQDAQRYHLQTDISALESDRLYGEAWCEFLKNAKSSLGVESGAGVFDFTGQIQQQVEAFEKKHPEAKFQEIKARFFNDLDGKIKLNQISPRCFECAAYKTLMILYEGQYSGILTPWRHYVPLKKNHSNIDEIVKIIHDEHAWATITECAYQEVALNPKYHYKAFIEAFDNDLMQMFGDSVTQQDSKQTQHKLIALQHTVPAQAPSFLRTVYRTLLMCLPQLLRKHVQNAVQLSLKRLQSLLTCIQFSWQQKSWYFMLRSGQQQFAEELRHISNLKGYISQFMQQTKINPMFIEPTSNRILLAPEASPSLVPENPMLTNPEAAYIECSNNFFLPETLRGKTIKVRYPKLISNYLLKY